MTRSHQSIQMVCAFLLAALFAVHALKVWHILALSFLAGVDLLLR